MELEELNRRLMELSESERAYRDGAVCDWGRYDQTVTIDGRRVYRLTNDPRLVARVESAGGAGGTAVTDEKGGAGGAYDALAVPTHAVPARPFAIRRNSRFNPVPEHIHEFVEMSYVYAGSCPQTVDGNEMLLKEGQVLLLDVDCPHSVGALGENDVMLSIMFTRDFLGQALVDATAADSVVSRFLVSALADQTNHQRHVRFHSQGSRRVRRCFEELMCEYLDPSPNAEAIMMRLFQLVMCELVNIYERDYTMRVQAERRGSVVPIIRYIEQNCAACTQEEVAEKFFVSPNYVNTLLKRHTGQTYMQTVQAERLTRASRLLRETGSPVEEVARACGYENLSFFYKKFRARFGCSPAEFREQAA